MNWLDMHTVMFGHLITEILGLIVIYFLWRQNRERYQGLQAWVIGFGLQLMGTILIVIRGAIPEWISIVFGNTIIVAGIVAMVEGSRRFVDARARPRFYQAILLGVFAGGMFYFSRIRPSLDVRTLIVAVMYALLFCLGAAAGFRRAPESGKRIAFRVGFTFALLALVNVIRIFTTLARPLQAEDFFYSGPSEVLFHMAYQGLIILMIYSFALMINERLIGEARFQEEKYAKAFRSSPYAISLTDAETGRFIEINEGFTRNLGFTREEAVGKTILELKIWEHEEDRVKAIAAVEDGEKIHEMEFRFRAKSGELIVGLWSAELILINDRPSILAAINNISIRKRALESLNRSLQENELLMKELKHRVKNSLTVVSSLLGLSRETAVDPEVKTVLADLKTRIGSISSVYELLDRTGRVDTIGLKDYIQNLADGLVQSYGPTDGRIRLKTDLADLSLDTKKALPLGLILNELIINAYKYAYPEGKSGEIRVELKSVTGAVCVTVSDDGIGKTAGLVLKEGSGTGTRLIETLTDQIGAHLSYPPGPGTTAVIIL